MPKTVTLRLSDEDYRKFQSFALADNRPIANAIETLALRKLEEMLFADPSETAAIIADESLTARLKSGSAQARRGKGRFVE